MRVLILGGNGYLGWPTALYLNKKGHTVHIVDGLNKQRWEEAAGVRPLLPILSVAERLDLVPGGPQGKPNTTITSQTYDIRLGRRLYYTLDEFDGFLHGLLSHP